MATRRHAKAGWRERRAERKRDKALRTGDTPEKLAERGQRDVPPSVGENSTKAGFGALFGGGM